MVKFITARDNEYDLDVLRSHGIIKSSLKTFKKWILKQNSLQYDIETTVIKDGPKALMDRKVITLQFGNKEEESFVIEYQGLQDDEELKECLDLIFDGTREIIAHNARFEYTVTKFHLGYIIENIHDTMLMSKVLNTGLDFKGSYHGLADCCFRWLDVRMEKDYQTSFVEHDLLSPEQIIYAATDVAPMHMLMDKMKKQLKKWGLWDLYNNIERHFLKVLGDMETSPMGFDAKYWTVLSDEFANLTELENANLNTSLMSDPFLYQYLLLNSKKYLGNYLVQPFDECIISWGGKDKKLFFKTFMPEEVKEMTKKPELTKWFYGNKKVDGNKDELLRTCKEQHDMLEMYLSRDFEKLNRYLIKYHKDWLLDNELFIPQGHLNINWNSTKQILFIFRYYRPELAATDEKTLAKITDVPVIQDYKRYAKASKFNSTYGAGFIDKHTIDGKYFAPRGGQQILSTGRISFGIALTMPSKDERAAKLRNGFLPPIVDWKILTTDYALVK